jgi:methylenetetrahydrofolate dehydrogenase (NADP+)/methenyltetrahydrofolate cyclohydrolase
MQLLYGKPVAEKIHAEIEARVSLLTRVPKLAVILVGNDPASHLYVGLKEKAAEADGIHFEKHVFSEQVSEEEVIGRIADLNNQEEIDGILVQLPLPRNFDADRIIGTLDPKKDADGFHASNISAFLSGDATKIPAFPEALMELLLSSEQPLEGQSAIVVVNSEHFGRVMLKAGAKHGLVGRLMASERLLAETDLVLDARVILSACGVPKLIREVNILPNTLLLDGGIAKDKEGKIVGDVDADGLAEQSGFLSPVPGGVGPVTIACLLRRVVALAEAKQKHLA